MTTKQINIIQAGIKLFSENGFNATSTSAIAKEADVSEGLIFKHFTNKMGLMHAILAEAEAFIDNMVEKVVAIKNHRERIIRAASMPFSVNESEYRYWFLIHKIKWELNYDATLRLVPLQDALETSFSEIEKENPKLEAEFVVSMLQGISISLVRNNFANNKAMHQFIIRKYTD